MEKKYKIYDYELAKNKLSFNDFVASYLGVKKREKELENTSLKVVLEHSEKFKEIITNAKEQKLKIAVIGDYDVDGITSTAIMTKLFDYLGIKCIPYIPNRFKDGYGLNTRIVKDAIKNECDVLVTVDNGIKAFEAIKIAKDAGKTVIVTDHHIASDELPCADLIINPHLGEQKNLKCNDICGALVAFFLARYVIGETEKNLVKEMLELAAIGTIADVMPLIYENRYAVKILINMMNLNNDPNFGISKLIKKRSIGRYSFSTESVSFDIGPCLNATGRIDSAMWGYKLLTSKKEAEVDFLVEKIDQLNNQRKQLTEEYTKQARQQIESHKKVNCLYLEKCPEGIIGIIAGKISELTDRPTFIFSDAEDKLKGSGRCPEWFNLFVKSDMVLKKMESDKVIGYGGHERAMGISLKNLAALKEFEIRLNKEVEKMVKPIVWESALRLPTNLGGLQGVKTIVDQFAPFGESFREPLFCIRTQIKTYNPMGNQHYRFIGIVEDKEVCFYHFFEQGNDNMVGKTFDVIFQIHYTISEKTLIKTYEPYVKSIKEIKS